MQAKHATYPQTRRGFIRLAAAGFVVGTAALLEACAPPAAPPPTAAPPKPTSAPPSAPTSAPAAAATSAPAVGKPAAPTKPGGVQLPTRVPLQTVKPDLASAEDGLIDAGFVNYPANPPKTVADTPGRGGEVTVVTWTTSALPTPMESNALWQAVNQELGVTLRISIQPLADYGTVKLPTLIASNELPDILYMAVPGAIIPQLPVFLKSKMADLTPYLSGDAIKDYPNLANFPTVAWRQVIYNKAIFGVPVPYPLFLWVHWVHQNLLDGEGLDRPKNADDYKRLAQHFTRPNQNLWGLGAENNVGMGVTNGWLTGIFGSQNQWALDPSGKLTHAVETEPYRAAVGYARDLWTAGIYHPNALQYNLVSARNDFAGRRFAFRFDGFQSASVTFLDAAPTLSPPAKPRIMTPFPAQDGGKPTFWSSSGILGFSAIRQAPPERIKEMLRILNWLAAPMGSQEYLLMNYGRKDVHWTPDANGNPVLNDHGRADALVPWRYITQGPVAHYYPKDPAYAQFMQDAEKAMYPFLSSNATDGYYSEAWAGRSGALARDLYEKINEIVVGRQPLSYFDQILREWKDGGGDQARAEFQQEIADARS